MSPQSKSTSRPDGWRLDLDDRPDLRPVLVAAAAELGVEERPRGSNAGPVLKYGGRPGDAWCAWFVSWCYGHLRPRPFRSTGRVRAILAWGERAGRLVDRNAAGLRPGDVFIIVDGPPTEERRHTGLVAADLSGGRVACVEGNHGHQVAGTIRHRDEFFAVVRPVPPPDRPAVIPA